MQNIGKTMELNSTVTYIAFSITLLPNIKAQNTKIIFHTITIHDIIFINLKGNFMDTHLFDDKENLQN